MNDDRPSAADRTLTTLCLQTRRSFVLEIVAQLGTEGVHAERFSPETFEQMRAEANWKALSTIENVDALRSALAGTIQFERPDTAPTATAMDSQLPPTQSNTHHTRNAEVAALLYRELLERFNEHLAQDRALPIAEWLLFIDRYCGKLGGLQPVGTLLRGLSHYAQGTPQATADFAEAAQLARDSGSAQALQILVACASAHAHTSASRRNSDALQTLETAASLTTSTHLQSYATQLRAWVEAREHALKILVEGHGTEAETAQVFDNAIVLDLAAQLEVFAISAIADGNVAQALHWSTILDKIALQHACLPEYTQRFGTFAVHHNAWACGEALLQEARSRGEHGSATLLLLARAIGQQGRPKEKVALLRELVAREPENSDAWRELGNGLHQLEAYEPAREALARAVSLAPDDQLAALELSAIPAPQVVYDQNTKQVTISAELLKDDPEQAAVMVTAALVMSKPGDLEENLQRFVGPSPPDFIQRVRETILGQRPAVPMTAVERAKQLFTQRRFAEAKIAYSEAIQEAPDDDYPYLGLGDCYYHLGEFYLAAAYFAESIAIRPTTSAWRFLGDAYRKVGRLNQARSAYESALALDPNYSLARQQLQAMQEIEES